MNRSGLTRKTAVAAAGMLVAGLITVAVSAGPAVAGPRPKVAPHQSFIGLVNGMRANQGPVTIAVACPGPIHPGETGHPIQGQTVEVMLSPAVSTGSGGNTGDDGTSIVAFFGPPPPTPVSPAPANTTVTFHRYSLERAIPSALELPCSGTGQVTFIPFPRTPPMSRAAVVPVMYASPLD